MRIDCAHVEYHNLWLVSIRTLRCKDEIIMMCMHQFRKYFRNFKIVMALILKHVDAKDKFSYPTKTHADFHSVFSNFKCSMLIYIFSNVYFYVFDNIIPR